MDGTFDVGEDNKMLFVGLVCVDILNIMAKFPEEDVGHRCLDYYRRRGGNASNSATVFSLLGGNVEFFGTLAKDSELAFIEDDFEKFGVCYENSVIVPNATCPLSVVILSQESHTRTVLHTNKNLAELTLEDFEKKVNLKSSKYGWIHFEGRDNAREIARMMTFINKFNKDNSCRITTSLEAEKLRFAAYLDQFEMWQLPDVMFVSKDFARSQGYNSMEEAAQAYHHKLKDGAVVICAWGEMGAAAMSPKTGLVVSPAFPPSQIVDTCGAGDTFNAATLFALSRGRRLKEAIEFGCRVAGSKCGMQGFDELKNMSFYV